MPTIPQHSLRRPLTDELHARPFTPLRAPAQALSLAFKPEDDKQRLQGARDHLAALVEHLGGRQAMEQLPEAPSHYFNRFGDMMLRWERHSEFVSVTLTLDRAPSEPFTPATLDLMPQFWLDAAPGPAIVSAIVEVSAAPDRAAAEARLTTDLAPFFTQESVASAWVTGGQALALSDFQMDARGLTRFAIVALPEIGPRRLGRIAQRLIELETYRTMAMLALPMAREVSPRLASVDRALSELTTAIGLSAGQTQDRAALDRLTSLSGVIQGILSETAFRFSAAHAYESIVDERIAALREERVGERQDFRDFMVRRFKPAMRTCHATGSRIGALATRAESVGNLLRTRVDVSLEAQNQELLTSMNSRAKAQLRLQQTVEGFSVVAISYYAVSLAGYVLGPIGEAYGVDAKIVQAIAAAPILLAVWFVLSRVKKRFEREN